MSQWRKGLLGELIAAPTGPKRTEDCELVRCLPSPARSSEWDERAHLSAREALILALKMPRRQAVAHALLLCASAAGFSMPHAPATRPRAELLTARRHAAAISMIEKIPSPDAGRFPFRSVVLGLLSLQSAIGLTQENELGGLITRFTDATLVTNYFNTFFDSAFLAYGANFLLNQAGYPNPKPNPSPKSNPNPNPKSNPNPNPNTERPARPGGRHQGEPEDEQRLPGRHGGADHAEHRPRAGHVDAQGLGLGIG